MRALLAAAAFLVLVSTAAGDAARLRGNGLIAYVVETTYGTAGIASVRLDGSDRRVVLRTPYASQPVPSSDGHRYAFVRTDGRGSTIFVGNGAQAPKAIAKGVDPAWSPDGTLLAFVAERGGLAVAAADGTAVKALGVPALQTRSIAWSPDGRLISFAADLSHLDVIRPDGTGRVTVADDAEMAGGVATWSSDGAWLAFAVDVVVLKSPGFTQAEMWLAVAHPDGSGRRLLARYGHDPVWAPTDERVAFADSDGLRVVDVANGARTTVPVVVGPPPVWSPDGTRLAFTGFQGHGLGVADAATGTVRWLNGGGEPSWSPDGTRLAVTLGKNLVVMDVTGAHRRRVARAAWGTPLWLADGSLVFGSAATSRFIVEALDPAAHARHALLRGPINWHAGGPPGLAAPVWSPDGRRIAFLKYPLERRVELDVAASNGSHPRRVAAGVETDYAENGDPAISWSPDGRTIAFRRHGIAVADVRTRRSRRVTRDDGDDTPAWSPDGSRIAFLHPTANGNALYVVGTDGSGRRRLLGDASFPAWAPDGRHLSAVSGDGGVAVVRVDGGAVRFIRSTGGVVEFLQWSPDGSRLLYEVTTGDCDSDEDPCHTRLELLHPGGGAPRRLPFVLEAPVWSPDGRWLLGFARGKIVARSLDGRRRIVIATGASPSWQPRP